MNPIEAIERKEKVRNVDRETECTKGEGGNAGGDGNEKVNGIETGKEKERHTYLEKERHTCIPGKEKGER